MKGDLVANVQRFLHTNSSEILTAFGVVGTVSTAYLAGRASFTAAEVIMYKEEDLDRTQDPLSFKERFKLVWKLYIPATVSGTVTVVAIVSSNRVSTNRAAAIASAYAITEKAFDEYKVKVVEQLGAGKEEKIRDEIAQDRVKANPPSGEVVVLGDSSVLCYEMYTGRYFQSDYETLRRAQNDLNFELINGHYCMSLNSWYDMIGLGSTKGGDEMGWDSDRQMELKFSATLTDAGQPCVAIDYNYIKPV